MDMAVLVSSLTLFRMRGGQKDPPPKPTRFSSVTSANVGLSPKNVLTFSFNPFATRKILSPYLVSVPNY